MSDSFTIDIRESDSNKLLARYDPENNIIEFQRRGIVTRVELSKYQRSAMSDNHVHPPSLTTEEELSGIKRAVFMNFIKHGSPLTEKDMTYEFIIELINDIGEDYTNVKIYKRAYLREQSAMSATPQGGETWRIHSPLT